MLQSPMVDEVVMNAVKEVTQPHLTSIYHVIGKQETAVQTTKKEEKDFLTPNRELSKLFSEKGFPYFYDEFDGDHTWTHWQPDLKRALKKMFS